MLEHIVDGGDFAAVVLGEALHDCFLIEGVVAGGVAVEVVGGFVVAFGYRILLGVVLAVGKAVVGIGAERGAQLLAGGSVFKIAAGGAVLPLLEQRVTKVVVAQTVVFVARLHAAEECLLIFLRQGIFAKAIVGFAQPQAGVGCQIAVIFLQRQSLGEIGVCLRGGVVRQRLHSQLIEHILLGGKHLVRRILDVADAGVCLVVVGGGEIGVNQIFLHLAGVTRVGIFVDELLEDVNRLVERRASALVLGDGIVVERCFGDVAVVVELDGFFKRNRCLVEFVQLQVALTDVEVGALREGVAFGGHVCQAAHRLVVGVGAIANHAIGIGCRAQRFVAGAVEVSLQIFFCLIVVAVLIFTFANDAAQLGIECRIVAVVQQRLGKRFCLVVLLLGEIYLCNVVLRIVCQFAVALHALEFGERLAVALVGIVDVGLIEGACSSIAARASQRVDVHQRLLIFAQAQQRIGAMVIHILSGIAVECGNAHLVVF